MDQQLAQREKNEPRVQRLKTMPKVGRIASLTFLAAVNMTAFATEGQDPIFWLHHCNIDRVWDMWLNLADGRLNPADTTFLDQQFTFVDEARTPITVKVRDILFSQMLGYRYDDVPNPASGTATTVAQKLVHQPAAASKEVIAASSPLPANTPEANAPQKPLGFKVERTELKVPDVHVEALRAAVDDPKAGRVVVEVQGIRLKETPNFTYGVYLNLPEGVTSPEEARPYYLGSLHLFGKGAMAAKSHGEHAPHAENAVNDFNQAFDASSVIDKLKRDGKWKGDGAVVTLLPLAPVPPRGAQLKAARFEESSKKAALSYRRIVVKILP